MGFWELRNGDGRRVMLNQATIAALVETDPPAKGAPTGASVITITGAIFPLPFSYDVSREMLGDELDLVDEDEDEDEGDGFARAPQ
jgi:hypothetical protein